MGRFYELGTAEDSSNAKGVIILTSASGLDARNVLFTDLAWNDFESGTITGTDGQKTTFAKRDIWKIIYFDSAYYARLDGDQAANAYRDGMQAREVVVNTSFLNLNANNL